MRLLSRHSPFLGKLKIRNFPPGGKSLKEWQELCDHFTSEKHVARSVKNKANRAKQTQSSTQGSRSYAASRHKEDQVEWSCQHLISL
ncbi:formin-like protein 18 [Tanacetum coccineum]